MRTIPVLAALALAFTVSGGSGAKAGSWCSWYDAFAYTCGFHSFEQCLENIRGVGGYCQRDVYASVGPREDAAVVERKVRKSSHHSR